MSGFDGFWEALDAVPVAEDAEALYDVGSLSVSGSRASAGGSGAPAGGSGAPAGGSGAPAGGSGAPAGALAGARLRRANLARYLDQVGTEADTLLVAEAPGWRGMTNTGVPFTSMRELDRLGPCYLVPPEPTAPWEASSRVVHAALEGWSGPLPLAWAIFPHHPFVAPDRLTNRTPRPAEVRSGAPVALALLEALGRRLGGRHGADPVRVVAVGRKAQGALALAGIDAIAVRHPAQGGAREFTEQLRTLDR